MIHTSTEQPELLMKMIVRRCMRMNQRLTAPLTGVPVVSQILK